VMDQDQAHGGILRRARLRSFRSHHSGPSCLCGSRSRPPASHLAAAQPRDNDVRVGR
jgi:hypothetical protein